MRTLCAAATALTVGLMLTSAVRADDKDKDNTKDQPNNATQTRTIRGRVAGVTVEGETAVDYQSNKAVVLEAAYLTVVGTPRRGQQRGDANNQSQNTANRDGHENVNGNRGGRHNVYLLWLSPKTKVCEAKSGGGDADKTECSLDKLEVGDRVEIQMIRRAESDSNNQGTPTEAMRKTHGRNRIYVGDATEITILAPSANRATAENSSRDADNDKDADNGKDEDQKNDKDD